MWQYSPVVHTLLSYHEQYTSHFANGKEPVIPQRWVIIIDAVTTLERRWASFHIALHIYCHITCCSHARFCMAIAGNQLLALLSVFGGFARADVCLAAVGSQIGSYRLITGTVNVETTKSAFARMAGLDEQSISKYATKLMMCLKWHCSIWPGVWFVIWKSPETLNTFVPRRIIRDINYPPWIDSEVINLSKKKETASKRARRINTQSDWAKYLRLRNSLRNI